MIQQERSRITSRGFAGQLSFLSRSQGSSAFIDEADWYKVVHVL